MKIRYEITHCDNANELPDYVPVTGKWAAESSNWKATFLAYLDGDCPTPARTAVAETVCNWLDSDFPIAVRLYHADGREITGDMPWEGTFVATRER